MLKLVVCEKPSVAQSISKVLGATKRGDGFLEGGMQGPQCLREDIPDRAFW